MAFRRTRVRGPRVKILRVATTKIVQVAKRQHPKESQREEEVPKIPEEGRYNSRYMNGSSCSQQNSPSSVASIDLSGNVVDNLLAPWDEDGPRTQRRQFASI